MVSHVEPRITLARLIPPIIELRREAILDHAIDCLGWRGSAEKCSRGLS